VLCSAAYNIMGSMMLNSALVMELFIDGDKINRLMRAEIKVNPSALIGLRSPVVSRVCGFTALTAKHYEALRGI
jgi:hypothetical protein